MVERERERGRERDLSFEYIIPFVQLDGVLLWVSIPTFEKLFVLVIQHPQLATVRILIKQIIHPSKLWSHLHGTRLREREREREREMRTSRLPSGLITLSAGLGNKQTLNSINLSKDTYCLHKQTLTRKQCDMQPKRNHARDCTAHRHMQNTF